MERTIYDVFISYRRDGGFDTAGRINDLLAQDGYSVSYDIDTLREGRFDEALLRRIEQCTDFILIVSRNAFARTLDPAVDPKDDWLRQELAYALQLRKNIIPVLLAGAEFPRNMPADIAEVSRYNGPKHSNEYFDSFYEKLKGMLHSLPRKAVAQGTSSAPAASLPNLKIKTDLDCIFYLDGEEMAHIKAGSIYKLPLAPGEYELSFVDVENAADTVRTEFEMPSVDNLYKVSLQPQRNQCLQTEAAARQQEEQRRRVEESRLIAEKKAMPSTAYSDSNSSELTSSTSWISRHRSVLLAIVALFLLMCGVLMFRNCGGHADNSGAEGMDSVSKEKDILTFTVNGVSFNMIRVEGGSFRVGSDDGIYNEKPPHDVTLSTYYIGETEVTQSLWGALMDTNNQIGDNVGDGEFYGEGYNYPMYYISWNECCEFILKLNDNLHSSGELDVDENFRLPTEAEWEFAACGGKCSKGYSYSGSGILADVAWYWDNSEEMTHPVKTKASNELGIYDMSGNVSEWCLDWYAEYNSSNQADPVGPYGGENRVIRGGSFIGNKSDCRIFSRYMSMPTNGYCYLGLRLAL